MLKAVVQKAISFLPYKHRINFLFQKYITKGVRLSDEYFTDKLTHHGKHEFYYHKHRSQSLEGKTILELGTGWYPVVPIAQYLSGADSIYSVDISPLMDRERLHATVGKFIEYAATDQLSEFLPHAVHIRLQALKTLYQNPPSNFESYLKALKIQYLVTDARHLALPDDSVDFITSNNVFEHIYPDILGGILKEFQRVLKPDGLMCHFIDMSDHFAHLDTTINIYHFLQFTEAEWERIDNSIQPQNRLRIPHYRALYESLGLPIIDQEHRPGDVEAVKAMELAMPYAELPPEEVAISHSYLVTGGEE